MKVIKTNEGTFLVNIDGDCLPFKTSYGVKSYLSAEGIAPDEIKMGFDELKAKGHNVIHFGIGFNPGGPKFIYTEQLK